MIWIKISTNIAGQETLKITVIFCHDNDNIDMFLL